MIILEFKVDHDVLKEDHEDDPVKSDVELAVTYFLFPVRLNVNNVEIFESTEEVKKYWLKEVEKMNIPASEKKKKKQQILSPYTNMAILDVAITGVTQIHDLKDGGIMVFEPMEDAGKYIFTRTGNIVRIKSVHDNREGVCTYNEIVQAFDYFSKKVRIFLLKEFPELVHHSFFGPWFRGEKMP